MTTLCATPRHDEPTPAEPHAALCRPCRLGLLRDLRHLPGLHADLEHLPPSGSGDGSGLPFSEPAADCRSQIRHDLTYWAREVAAVLKVDLPDTAPYDPKLKNSWWWTSRPVFIIGAFIAREIRWIPFRDWAPDMAGALSADHGRAVALLNPFIKTTFEIPGELGICLHCPARVIVTVYRNDDDRRRSFLACPGCGERWEPEQWMSYGRQVIRRREAMAS